MSEATKVYDFAAEKARRAEASRTMQESRKRAKQIRNERNAVLRLISSALKGQLDNIIDQAKNEMINFVLNVPGADFRVLVEPIQPEKKEEKPAEQGEGAESPEEMVETPKIEVVSR